MPCYCRRTFSLLSWFIILTSSYEQWSSRWIIHTSMQSANNHLTPYAILHWCKTGTMFVSKFMHARLHPIFPFPGDIFFFLFEQSLFVAPISSTLISSSLSLPSSPWHRLRLQWWSSLSPSHHSIQLLFLTSHHNSETSAWVLIVMTLLPLTLPTTKSRHTKSPSWLLISLLRSSRDTIWSLFIALSVNSLNCLPVLEAALSIILPVMFGGTGTGRQKVPGSAIADGPSGVTITGRDQVAVCPTSGGTVT